jgi:DNA polymerase V
MYSIVSQSTPIALSDVQTLILQIKNQVCAGFPSPAEDLGAERIDLSKVLIKHPQATFLLKASGLLPPTEN